MNNRLLLVAASLSALALGACSNAPDSLYLAAAKENLQSLETSKAQNCGTQMTETDLPSAPNYPAESSAVADGGVGRFTHHNKVQMFWHNWAVENCQVLGQNLNRTDGVDVPGRILKGFDDVAFIATIENDQVVVYEVESLEGLAKTRSQYNKAIELAHSLGGPDSAERDRQIEIVVDLRENLPDNQATAVINQFKANGGLQQGNWAFLNAYPGHTPHTPPN